MSLRTWTFVLTATATAIVPAFAQAGDAARGGATESRPQAGRERDELATHAQRAMEELRAAVEELARRAEKATGEARSALEQQLRSLREDQKKLESRLEELRAATAQQWKQLHDEIEKALRELRRPDPKPQRETI